MFVWLLFDIDHLLVGFWVLKTLDYVYSQGTLILDTPKVTRHQFFADPPPGTSFLATGPYRTMAEKSFLKTSFWWRNGPFGLFSPVKYNSGISRSMITAEYSYSAVVGVSKVHNNFFLRCL